VTLPCAEDVNYWRTGRSSPDAWLDKACRLIDEVGGIVHGRVIGYLNGRGAIQIAFEIEGEPYRLAWPVLTTRDGDPNHPAARIQAATFIYHDVKAKAMTAKVFGPARAFVEHRLIGPGRTVADLSDQSAVDLANAMPRLLPERTDP